LCWIKNDWPWKTYAQNKIRKLTDRDLWRFCPGKENPACMAADFDRNDLWWNGPSFLGESIDQWPNLTTTFDGERANEELVKNPPVITHTLTVTNKAEASIVSLEKVIVLERFGSMLNLLRVTAIVRKFTSNLIHRVRNQGNTRSEPQCLSAVELKAAE